MKTLRETNEPVKNLQNTLYHTKPVYIKSDEGKLKLKFTSRLKTRDKLCIAFILLRLT